MPLILDSIDRAADIITHSLSLDVPTGGLILSCQYAMNHPLLRQTTSQINEYLRFTHGHSIFRLRRQTWLLLTPGYHQYELQKIAQSLCSTLDFQRYRGTYSFFPEWRARIITFTYSVNKDIIIDLISQTIDSCDKELSTQPIPNGHGGSSRQSPLYDPHVIMAFQPIIHYPSGYVKYYEVLARLADAQGNVMSPGQFFPALENENLMRALDLKMLELSLQAMIQDPTLSLSVNVSPATAEDPLWFLVLKTYVKSYASISSRLMIEMTESTAFSNIEASERFISNVRALGCKIAIDDFGAGYISLSHLRKQFAHVVKIDGRYIKDVIKNPHPIRVLCSLAHEQGIDTVAECVETEEQIQALIKEGVNYLQGYQLGKPKIVRTK